MAYLLSGRAGCRTCTTGALIAVSVDGAASKPGTLYPGAGDLMIIDAVSITAPYRADLYDLQLTLPRRDRVICNLHDDLGICWVDLYCTDLVQYLRKAG